MEPTPRILNIAHRGARSLAPENTLAAARKALSVGADWWELDVAMTLDGELVVLHDDTLKHTSNAAEIFPTRRPWNVHSFTLEELKCLDFGSWFNQKDPFGQISAGNVSLAEQQSYAGEPIPTLRQALELTRVADWRVNVEIKDHRGTDGDTSVVEKVACLVDELDMVDCVMVSSFSHDYLLRCKAVLPGLRTAALVEFPELDPEALMLRTGATAFNPGGAAVLPSQIRALKRRGLDVFVWTVNREPAMRRLIRAGVRGLFTDFPQVLHRLLEQSQEN